MGMNFSDPDEPLTILGRVTAHYGVRGWVRIRSHTRPRDEILRYDKWVLAGTGQSRRDSGGGDPGKQVVSVVESRPQRNGFIVRLDGVSSREQAEALIGANIAIPVASLPELPPGEYYWEQLTGLRVVNVAGETMGIVGHLLETGANDVLVVQREGPGDDDSGQLLPWIPQVIRSVDIAAGVIEVDWDFDD
jgi:16S rRNA processing protein RimM